MLLQNASFLEIRTDWSPSKFEFGNFGVSNFSERLEPSIRIDGSTPFALIFLWLPRENLTFLHSGALKNSCKKVLLVFFSRNSY